MAALDTNPAVIVGLWAVLFIPTLVIDAMGRHKPGRSRFNRDAAQLAIIGSLAGWVIINIFIFDSMWLPLECVALTTGGRPAVGYVLEDDGRWTTLLRDSDRAIAMLRSDDVKERQICRTEDPSIWTQSLAEIVNAEPGPAYVQCPDD